MNGMTCKQCDTNEMAWTTDTEPIGNKGGKSDRETSRKIKVRRKRTTTRRQE